MFLLVKLYELVVSIYQFSLLNRYVTMPGKKYNPAVRTQQTGSPKAASPYIFFSFAKAAYMIFWPALSKRTVT